MITEVTGYFTLGAGDPDLLTFVGWHFEDPSELAEITHNIPGIIVLAHIDKGKEVTASDAFEIQMVSQSENVHTTLCNMAKTPDKVNLVLIRQVDNPIERNELFYGIRNKYL